MKFNGIGSGTRMTVNQWVSGNIPKQPYVEGMDKYIQDGSPIVMVGLNSGVMTAKQYLYDETTNSYGEGLALNVKTGDEGFKEKWEKFLDECTQLGDLTEKRVLYLVEDINEMKVILSGFDVKELPEENVRTYKDAFGIEITGDGEERMNNAKKALDDVMNKSKSPINEEEQTDAQKRYAGDALDMKLKKLIDAGVINANDLEHERGQYYDLMREIVGKDEKDLFFFQTSTTGITKEPSPRMTGQPIRFYSVGGGYSADYAVVADSDAVKMALKNESFDTFKHSGLIAKEYVEAMESLNSGKVNDIETSGGKKSLNVRIGTTDGKSIPILKKETFIRLLERYTKGLGDNVVLIGNGEARNKNYDTFAQEALSNLGNLSICHKKAYDFSQIIKEVAYIYRDKQLKGEKVENPLMPDIEKKEGDWRFSVDEVFSFARANKEIDSIAVRMKFIKTCVLKLRECYEKERGIELDVDKSGSIELGEPEAKTVKPSEPEAKKEPVKISETETKNEATETKKEPVKKAEPKKSESKGFKKPTKEEKQEVFEVPATGNGEDEPEEISETVSAEPEEPVKLINTVIELRPKMEEETVEEPAEENIEEPDEDFPEELTEEEPLDLDGEEVQAEDSGAGITESARAFDEIKNSIDKLQNSYEEMESNRNSLSKAVDELNDAIVKKDEEIKSLKEALAEKEKEIEEAKKGGNGIDLGGEISEVCKAFFEEMQKFSDRLAEEGGKYEGMSDLADAYSSKFNRELKKVMKTQEGLGNP